MFNHSCIKCKAQYSSSDPDAYYCEVCNEERLRIAKEIDAKVQARPQKETVSALEAYDNAPKFNGFMIVKL